MPPVLHDIQIESFWPNFEMMKSQHGARISKFWENRFINKYLTSKFLFLLIFIFLSPLVPEIQVSSLFRANFELMASPRWFKTLRDQIHKQKIYLAVPSTFDFQLSIKIGTWNINFNLLTHFDQFDPFLGW